MLKFHSLIVIAGMSFGVMIQDPVLAGDGAEEKAKQVAIQFLKAVKAKDLDAALRVSGVPWLDAFEERIIEDRAELKRVWQEKLRDLDSSRIPEADVEAMPYTEFCKWAKTGDDEADDWLRKLHEEIVLELNKVLDETSWIVTMTEKGSRGGRFILVRVRDGKAEVVGGPSGTSFLYHASRIPGNARTILEKADRLELLSLDPKYQEEKPKDDFHGWNVLGRTVIKDATTRMKLVVALKQGAEESEGSFAGCFNPRHGIRVTHDGETADFVICFECVSVQLYVGKKTDDSFQITRSPQPVFDEVLRRAGVPLAEKSKK